MEMLKVLEVAILLLLLGPPMSQSAAFLTSKSKYNPNWRRYDYCLFSIVSCRMRFKNSFKIQHSLEFVWLTPIG